MTRGDLRWLAGVAMAALVGCGGSSPSPDPGGGGGGGGNNVSGSERLGWNQSAADSSELATFRYAAYVDGGSRAELNDVSCSGASPFSCSSRFPSMAAGSHSIELASFVIVNGTVIESPRSAPLQVNATSAINATAPSSSTNADSSSSSSSTSVSDATTADGVTLRVEVIAQELEAPTALAFTPDGRILVGERGGRVHTLRADKAEPASTTMIDDVLETASGAGGLLAIALDPEFGRTGFVYALYTAASGAGERKFRVVRFREAGGRLGERAVLLDDVPASPRPAAALGIGPDGLLYVAFDDSGDAARAKPLAAYSGKVLRVTRDGKTPDDRSGTSPVHASDFQSPRGLDWHPATQALWIADVKQGQAEELRVTPSGPSRPNGQARVQLPAETGAASLAFYRGDLLPQFQGNAFVAADQGRHLLRLRFDDKDSTRVVSSERLLADTGAAVRVVSVGPDGALYVGTERTLLRIGPK